MTATQKAPWPALLLLMAIGLVARLINLSSGLWYDEIVTLVKYVGLAPSELLTTCTEFNNHMLFSLMAHGCVAGFGESAWALRLPAVLFGVAAIPAMWWFAAPFAGSRVAMLAATLLVFEPHHIQFSQSARGYTGLLFFTLVATGLFLRGLRTSGIRIWFVYAVVNALALFTHLTAAFMITGHALIWLFLLVTRRLGGREHADGAAPAPSAHPLVGIVLSGVLGFLLYAPLVPALARSFQEHVGMQSSFTKVPEWTTPGWTLRELIEGLGLSPLAIAAAAVVGLLALAGFVSMLRRDRVAVAAMVLPAVIALAIFWGFSFHIWPRYFFHLLGFGLIFVVQGIDAIASAMNRDSAQGLAKNFTLILVAGSLWLSLPHWRLPKQDYEGARDFVAASRKADEPVLTSGMAALSYTWLYAKDWKQIDDVAALDAAAAGKHAWFVYAFPTQLKASNPGVLERVQATFDVVREFPGTVREGAVVVCRSR